MKWINYIFLFLIYSGYAQDSIQIKLINSLKLEKETIISIDDFETLYHIKNNTFYKTSNNKSINYSNVQLGNITSANAFNPLKINLFYKSFNTVVILDNRLAEIFKIDFNMMQPYKNVSHITTGFDNSLWVFNQDLQQLELYDYKMNKVKVRSLPVQSNVLDLKSNYNYCWMLTEKYLYKYNYLGSLISKMENKGFTEMALNNENVVLKTDNQLYFLASNSQDVVPIQRSKLLINQFLLANETLYIYDNKILSKFQLKIK